MKRGKHMKIVNNTQVDNPNQWIESFVEEVLDNAKIDCEQILRRLKKRNIFFWM